MAHDEPRRGKRVSENEDAAKAGPGKLSRAWNKSARSAKKVLLTGILALSLSGGFTAVAHAETRDTRPPAAATSAMSKAEKQQKKDYAFSQERLDKIENNMRRTDLGRALLQFAEDQHIRISMSNSKTIDSDPKDNLFTKGRNYSTYILLNGETRSDDEIMMTLAHELRHSWHERTVKSGEMELDPRRHWLMRRIQEADAFSFEVHFGYEYEKATGKQLDIGDRYNACNGKTPFICLAEEYRQARDGGKPAAEAYSQLLEQGLRHVRAMKYDKTFAGELDDGWGAAITAPAAGAAYANRFDHPVTDADFIAKMRAVATEGLAPGVDPAVLTKWTDADFLSFDKTGGKDKGDMKKLAAAEKKFAAAKDAWDKYEAARTPPPAPPPAPPGA